MARPTEARIDPDAAAAVALDLIDRDGLQAFSLRRLATALGVAAPSLYHHFRDKDAILELVRVRIAREVRLTDPIDDDDPWQTLLTTTTNAYRSLLLLHPNMAPLMAPTVLLRPFSLLLRDRVADHLRRHGVASHLVYPIIDSAEALAYASALLNPDSRRTVDRITFEPDDRVAALRSAIDESPEDADEVWALQLEALVAGWGVLADAAP